MYEELMEQVVRPENATAAWKAVKRNKGAPGIDGMTVEQLRDHVRQHWETIRAKLLAGTYVPSQRNQERGGPTVGTEVPGISHQPGREDRSGPQECGTIQTESSGILAELPESEQ